MKASDARTTAKNGSRKTANGHAPDGPAGRPTRKRPAARAASAQHGFENGGAAPAIGNPEVADFIAVETREVDVPSWPAHPVVWLQPDLKPGLPAASGLRIERHHKIPAPGFAVIFHGPQRLSRTVEHWGDFVPPEVRLDLPASDLAPVGWDPRAASVARARIEPDVRHEGSGVELTAAISNGRHLPERGAE